MVFSGAFLSTALAITLGIGFFGQGADTVPGAICGSAPFLSCLLFRRVALRPFHRCRRPFQATNVSLSVDSL